MKQSGSADMPLWKGSIPPWLFERMTKLGLAMTEAILMEYGTKGWLSRMSDPFWFQSFGAVIGMDWNSSGVTTAVMAALKKGLNPHARELGLYVCGGKGKQSQQTPVELTRIGDHTGLDGLQLARHSKLSAKVDNTAIQDGFQIYQHNFLLDRDGNWSVVQQGMQAESGMARRYHWHSDKVKSFVEEPHTFILGENQGEIINMVDKRALPSQSAMLEMTQEKPEKMIQEIQKLVLPSYCDVKVSDINPKRLAALFNVTRETPPENFEELLLTKGVGPRTVQSLALVSEVIYGKPSRFTDPARFSFAHGGKSGKPFAVPTYTYDETISTLEEAVKRAKVGAPDKQKALEKLHKVVKRAEAQIEHVENPEEGFHKALQHERDNSYKYGGRTPKGFEKPPKPKQLGLFD
ncbi:MAG: DUF763 domain-containing protein [Bacteroidota bacterium]